MFIVYLHIIFHIELFAVHTQSSRTLLMRYYKRVLKVYMDCYDVYFILLYDVHFTFLLCN